jgi:hypothetical protein
MILALGFILYTVAALGLAYVIGFSVITRGFRTWLAGEQLARCPVCGEEGHVSLATGNDGIGWPCAGKPGTPPHEQAYFEAGYRHPWRGWLVTLLECPACFGWHVGFWLGLAATLLFPTLPFRWWLPPALAFYTAGSNFILGRATGLMPDPLK